MTNVRMAVLLAASMSAGCDGVGAALVGEIPDDPLGSNQCNTVSQPCSSTVPTLEPPGLGGGAQLLLCKSSCAPGQSERANPCDVLQVEPDRGTATVSELPCQNFSLDLRGTAAPVRLEATSITLSSLTVKADRAVELTVAALALEDAELELDGPITLRFEPDTALRQVHVSSTSAEAVVTIDRARGQGLVIDGADGLFPGRVALYGASFSDSAIRAAALELESVQLTRTEIEASDLRAADVSLQWTALAVGTGTIASGKAERLHVNACDSLLLAGIACEDCVFRGCSGDALRLDSVQLARGFVLGDTTFVAGSVGGTLFGMGEPTRLRLFGVQFDANVLCDGVEGLGLARTEPTCVDCRRAELADPALTCDSERDGTERDAGATTDDGGTARDVPRGVANPLCPELAELPRCDPPLTADRPFL